VTSIGPYKLDSRVVLAPMAGVTDQPFRVLCRHQGAALAASEMITSNIKLWNREKCRLRRRHDGESEPRVVQIAGADPEMMAEAALINAAEGAQVIDINMGCPAKKVLKKSAGSALLQYPDLVEEILSAVVRAVDIPVTLKIRTGWNTENRNGLDIARLAEDCGIQSLAVHGRTRACAFKGEAEYDTIASIKQAISIPVFANGDIGSPEKAKFVLDHTGADGVMIGRGAQGRPWIFAEINHYLEQGTFMIPLNLHEIHAVVRKHLLTLHEFYGPEKGIFYARKHVTWYLQHLAETARTSNEFSIAARKRFNAITQCSDQLEVIDSIFSSLKRQQLKQPSREMAA
jgi:tRNA-dihydrouridine synthase B